VERNNDGTDAYPAYHQAPIRRLSRFRATAHDWRNSRGPWNRTGVV